MKQRPPLPPGPYLVVGLARSGSAAALALRAHGEVIGCDARRPPDAEALEGVEVHLESDGLSLLDRVRTVVKSPGIPADSPLVTAARSRGLEVVGELEVAWRLVPNEFLAVTGTNGKTTTVELLGAIHREAGLPVEVAGNVGTAVSSLVERVSPEATVVCETSSFQLEDASHFAPECAVLLNLADDHLDRHGDREAYRAAKLRIFAAQGNEDVAVVPAGMSPPGCARVVTFGGEGAEVSRRGGVIWWGEEPLLRCEEVRLRGEHNLENAVAASAAALARGVDRAAVVAALRTFRGVPHRLEDVAERDGVLYVNDSKATNVTAARAAIEAFAGGVHLILGGRAKGEGFEELREPVTARCRACYLIGEAAERIAADLAGTVPLRSCGELERAVEEARAAAEAGEVVLLAPACASYDQYDDYEARGEHFRALATDGATAPAAG